MEIDKFENWLKKSDREKSTIQNRLSNCKHVEEYEGDLDIHFEKDKGFSLLEKLKYTTEDQELGKQPKHSIPINGDIRNGSSTLKHATKLYFDFKTECLHQIEKVTFTENEKKYNNKRNTINKIEFEKIYINLFLITIGLGIINLVMSILILIK